MKSLLARALVVLADLWRREPARVLSTLAAAVVFLAVRAHVAVDAHEVTAVLAVLLPIVFGEITRSRVVPKQRAIRPLQLVNWYAAGRLSHVPTASLKARHLLDVRNHLLARKLKAHGMQHSLRIVLEARAQKIAVSLGAAILEQETGDAANVFGHDPTIFVGAGEVTESKYRAYLHQRGAMGRGGMQGVGPGQLTWWATQDHADQLGGCWKPACNIRVAFATLAANIAAHGKTAGIKAYNGTGPAADAYAKSVTALERKWHGRLA